MLSRECGAQELGADALVNVRFEVATTMNRLVVGLHATVVCYGTVSRVNPHGKGAPVLGRRAADERSANPR